VDCFDGYRNASAQFFSAGSESTKLIIAEAEPSISQLFKENTILLGKALDSMLLMLVEPTRKARNNEMKED